MKKTVSLIFAALTLCLCQCCTPKDAVFEGNRAEAIAARMHDPATDYVVVAVHRGDWRNYPENSIPAIESVIRMGADIVEIDIHRTADSVLVVCHDADVRRTTNFSKAFKNVPGKSSKIANMTLADIKTLLLKRGQGVETDTLRMPTLEEALLCTKDRICVNIDKGYEYYDQVLELSERLGVTDQVLIKSKRPLEVVAEHEAPYEHNVMYMPVCDIQKESGKALFDSYMEKGVVPLAYELCWQRNDDGLFRELARKALDQGSKVWVNTIWASLCGGLGNDDDAAFECEDPGQVYQQYIDAGVSMIQTDRPEMLINWLEKTGHHTLK
ncbi:MAG: glycerophosphodiester phosphodiesterase family protein [Bacteroidales bacterium]|nr:glycerophosphodiester phosphodiesterase family protein [Bacteroidales bacterium]